MTKNDAAEWAPSPYPMALVQAQGGDTISLYYLPPDFQRMKPECIPLCQEFYDWLDNVHSRECYGEFCSLVQTTQGVAAFFQKQGAKKDKEC